VTTKATTKTTIKASAKVRAEALHEPAPSLLDELAATAGAIAGMQASMLDRRSLRHTLNRRMAAKHFTGSEAYLAFYTGNQEEQSIFLEGVLIGETSFFRDAAVFAEMSRWCLGWFARHERPMRILSAPCSSGEEPYSIAITLAQAGIALDRFSIEALDISNLAIEQARAAVYKGFSLRNLPHPEQAKFLEPFDDGWRVTRPFRDLVRFRQANLMHAHTLGRHQYDLICSRNLLLYQNPEARRCIAAALANALEPGGRLIVGAADWGRDLDEFFLLEEPVHSFALRLRPPQESTLEQTTYPKTSTSARRVPLKSPAKRQREKPTDTPGDASGTASRLLADANEIYRKALRAFLRGEEREAERLCRQTLYLEEDHMPSLELLSRINRPHASNRMQLALRARLKRHRDAVAQGEAR